MTRRELRTRIEEMRDECGREEDYEAHALLAMLAWRLESLSDNQSTRSNEAPAEPERQNLGRPYDPEGYVPWYLIDEDR